MKKILAELKGIVLARPLDFLQWQEGRLELKKLEDIPRRSRGAIAKIERNTTGIKVVFHDKLKAAELLLRFSQQQTTAESNNLLQAILDSTSDEVDTTFMDEMEEKDDYGIFVAEGD